MARSDRDQQQKTVVKELGETERRSRFSLDESQRPKGQGAEENKEPVKKLGETERTISCQHKRIAKRSIRSPTKLRQNPK